MKTVVQHVCGAPRDVLRLGEATMPAVGAEDVLVSVRASSANPWDWRAGALHPRQPTAFRVAGLGGLRKPGFEVPGGDVATVVERVGSGVTAFTPGDEA